MGTSTVHERQSYFVAMPSYVLDVLIDQPRLIQIWLVLASYANKDGEAWPSREAISERCGCDVKTITRATAELVNCDLLSVRHTPTGNVYVLPVWERKGAGVLPERAQMSFAKELDSVELDNPLAASAPRERDKLFDAVCIACHIDPDQITKPGRGSLNAALKAMREVGATPSDVFLRGPAYERKFPNAPLTPSALAKHWGSLAPPPVASNVRELYPGQTEPVEFVGRQEVSPEEKDRGQARLRELSERFRSERT